jgi:multidrug efflux system membrane fusion protein
VKDKFVAIGVVLAALFLAVMMNVLQPDAEKTSEPEAAIAVKTEIVNRAQLAMRVESQGIVAPRTRTSIISEVSGLVLDVADAFVVGGTFNAGDMLLKLDPTDYEVALQRAKAKVISFKALMELENARSVQAEKEWGMTGRPKSEAPLLALRRPYLLEAEANLLQAQAEVKQAEIKLSKTIIRASYSGMVSKKLADIGQFVTTGTPIGETFAIDFVEIRLPLSEKDLTMMDG